MTEYNEGWNEIINHALDEVGMKKVEFEMLGRGWNPSEGNIRAVAHHFAIFNNGFKVKYTTNMCGDVCPIGEDYILFGLPQKTINKFYKEVKILEIDVKRMKKDKENKEITEKSSFIREWYKKQFGGIK